MSDVLGRIFRYSQVFRSYPLCHSRPDRSFCYNGRYFGLCARCTAMYLGGFLALLLSPFWLESLSGMFSIGVGIVLLIPSGIDGTMQMIGRRESTNTLRVVTGAFLGIGVVLFIHGLTLFLHKNGIFFL